MADSIDVLKAIAPEFAGETDDTLETFLDLAAQELDAPTWGKLYQQGAVYLAAHKLAIRERGQSQGTGAGNVSGPVNSVSTGDLSVGYGSPTGFATGSVSEAALSQTKYGQQFLELQNRILTTPITSS